MPNASTSLSFGCGEYPFLDFISTFLVDEHHCLFEIQKQSRPDGTERIGKSAVSKEVAHSILPSFEYCNEENWKESTH